jgi:hypothetical protein
MTPPKFPVLQAERTQTVLFPFSHEGARPNPRNSIAGTRSARLSAAKPPASPWPTSPVEPLRSCDEPMLTSFACPASHPLQLKRHSALSPLPSGPSGRQRSSCDRRPRASGAAVHGCCYHSDYRGPKGQRQRVSSYLPNSFFVFSTPRLRTPVPSDLACILLFWILTERYESHP